MQLYRLMTDVRAGATHPGCVPGQAGIATIWVRAEGEDAASARGKEILARRKYQSHGELKLYLEETPDDAEYSISEARTETGRKEGEILSGYSEIKHVALEHGDGLFEAWFPS